MLRIRPVIFALGAVVLATGCFACSGSSPGGGTTSASAGATPGGGAAPGGVAAPGGGVTPAAHGPMTMCQPYQATAVDGGTYTLQDDEWGSSAAECVSTEGGTGFVVTKSAIANPAYGNPGSYPDLYAGCNWGACTKGGLTADPPQIIDMNPGSVTTSLATTDPPGGAYDVSYDIWVNQTPSTPGAPDGLEVMVWLNHHGGVEPAGNEVASDVQVGGYDYDVWYSSNAGNGPCVTYVMTTARTAVSGLDLGPLFYDAGQRGYLSASWYLIAVEAGFEIWNGGAGLAVNSFSVALQ